MGGNTQRDSITKEVKGFGGKTGRKRSDTNNQREQVDL